MNEATTTLTRADHNLMVTLVVRSRPDLAQEVITFLPIIQVDLDWSLTPTPVEQGSGQWPKRLGRL